MSRMTSAQVIAIGEYLEPSFDPNSLTVSQLLGVLSHHNIRYPTPYSKPKLVTTFNEAVKPNIARFKEKRVLMENSIASDDGILDGATGQPLRKHQVVRRASRRLSRTSGHDDGDEIPHRPDPPKRRRSSAQPVMVGTSRQRSSNTQPTLIEESEPEEELPVKKVGRNKKTSEAAGVQARRVSNPTAEDSGWEDNNIFQSGAESSSPARPSPARSKIARKNSMSRRSRKSSSAPPQMLSSPPVSPTRISGHAISPPQSSFQPVLPALSPARLNRLGRLGPSPPTIAQFKDEESPDELDLIDVQETIKEDPEEGYASQSMKEDEDPFLVTSKSSPNTMTSIPDGLRVITKRSTPERGLKLTTVIFRLLCCVIGIATSYIVVEYKKESAFIGYCDAGTNSNRALEGLKAYRLAAEACYRENRTHMDTPIIPNGFSEMDLDAHRSTPCPPPPLVPWLQPEACTPCPDHAKCSQYAVTCAHGYILEPYSLLSFLPVSSSPRDTVLSFSSSPAELFWKVLSEVLDGLPGLGSVALPPKCVEDPKRKRNIGALGKAIESLLGQERGRRLCAGGNALEEPVKDIDGGEAKRWGLELQSLREMMKAKTPHHLLPTFDDTFNEAIQQLIQWGGIIIGEDQENHRYVSHKTPDLTWDCIITVKSREAWAEWRTTVFGSILAILSLLVARIRRAQRRVESKRVADLVQIALDTLRNQELAHHSDPVTAPQPYLSSLQLRDLILQDEHSISSRSRLWNQVERIVEGNANVRANLEEMQGGDEMRVWRWIGSSGGVRNQLHSGSNGDAQE